MTFVHLAEQNRLLGSARIARELEALLESNYHVASRRLKQDRHLR